MPNPFYQISSLFLPNSFFYTFKKGTVTLTIDEDDDAVFAELLGHEVGVETKEMVRKDTDVAPYVGVGRILTKVVNGVYKYKVEFLPKVKFSEPAQEEQTKGDNIEFKTPSIEGVVQKLADGTWSKTKTFTDKTEAITYLEGLLAKSAQKVIINESKSCCNVQR